MRKARFSVNEEIQFGVYNFLIILISMGNFFEQQLFESSFLNFLKIRNIGKSFRLTHDAQNSMSFNELITSLIDHVLISLCFCFFKRNQSF